MSKTAEKPQGVITKDPELAALALMDRKLAALPQDARERVLGWLQQKHSAKLCKLPTETLMKGPGSADGPR